jgi:hypothetical protein
VIQDLVQTINVRNSTHRYIRAPESLLYYWDYYLTLFVHHATGFFFFILMEHKLGGIKNGPKIKIQYASNDRKSIWVKKGVSHSKT